MADYFKIGLDDAVSAFDICQAHQQLEADYNVGGMLRERQSNRRRNESTGCQLLRMRYESAGRWVEIYPQDDDATADMEDAGDDHVRQIYMMNVLKWRLPVTEDEKAFMRGYWTKDFLQQYPWVFEPGNYQGEE